MPCGDFSWMQDLVKKNIDINYTGYDIVKDIIAHNNKKYSSNKINFFCRDIVNEKTFDNFDLIFIRDFFIHIDNESINRILINIKNSKVKFLACSNNNNESFNNDVIFICNAKSKFKAKGWIFWYTKAIWIFLLLQELLLPEACVVKPNGGTNTQITKWSICEVM